LNFDSSLIASGGMDKFLKIWNMGTSKCVKTLLGHINTIWCVDFSDDGRLVASGGSDQVIKLWELNSEKCE